MKHNIAQSERRIGKAGWFMCKVRDNVALEICRNPGRLGLSHGIVVGEAYARASRCLISTVGAGCVAYRRIFPRD